MQVPMFGTALPPMPTCLYSSRVDALLIGAVGPYVFSMAFLPILMVRTSELVTVLEVDVAGPSRVALFPSSFKHAAFKEECAMTGALAT